MANKIGLYALKPAPHDLSEVARQIERENAPQDALVDTYGTKSYDDWTCYVIEGDEYAYAPDWCQAISVQTGCLGVSVFVFEGNWDFNVFHRGEHIAGREAYVSPNPVLWGDLDKAAKLLNVSADLFRNYCVSPVAGLSEKECDDELLEELEEKFDGYRAYPGDEFEPWDEWGFCDFTKKLGFDYPDPGDRTRITIRFDGVARDGTEWRALPRRLGKAEIVFRATQPKNPSQGNGKRRPWWKFW